MTEVAPAMALSASILTSILLFSVATAQTDNGNECSCFKTNDSTVAYFTYHRFWDFRNIVTALSTEPNILIDPTSTSNADPTSSYFASDSWSKDWALQRWNNSDRMNGNNATVLMINSPNNVYIQKSADSSPEYSSYLTLRTTRTSTFQSAAEFESTKQNFQYLSWRFLGRVIGSSGACAGVFTYLASTSVQEADIEILTNGPRNVVQYTNQPSVDSSGEIIPAATVNATIPGGLDWSIWNHYRLDWIPTQSSWYVNGQSVANISFQAPRDPAGLNVNMWSDGGSWTGNMSLHDAAYLQIQYIELVYNTSGPYARSSTTQTHASLAKRAGVPLARLRASSSDFATLHKRTRVQPRDTSASSKGCKVVCSIDEAVNATSIGIPVVVANNTAGRCAWPPMRSIGFGLLGVLGWFLVFVNTFTCL